MTYYVELHLHSCYSFLDGASTPQELVDRAVALGYPALALTDHDGLYGSMEFAQACRDAGIQPITGAEITLNDGSHLTLLAETSQGYANLCRLITSSYREGDRLEPRLPAGRLHRHSDGLILLTGCRHGKLSQLVDAERLDDARLLLDSYIDWFGRDQVFVELQQNLVHGDTARTTILARLAAESNLPTVATGNVHYHLRDRWKLQGAMTAVKQRLTLDTSYAERRVNSEWQLQSQELMARRFGNYPEALQNTLRIASRCARFDLNQDLSYHFPAYPTAKGMTIDALLEKTTRQQLAERYGDDPKAQTRLTEELELINQHGLAGFFMIYHEIMNLASTVAEEVRGPSQARMASKLPPGRGRGSSVSSIICYLLGLSHIDPLKYDLKIGRFLNDELYSVPDIDIDFPRDIREELILRIYETYGHDHAAMVAAFSTYKVRSAIRDLGKVLGLPGPSIDQVAKLSNRIPATELASHLDELPDLKPPGSPLWGHLVDLASQIAGMPRHVSQHSGGMVISSTPLIDLVPVQPAAMEGRFICQWDKDSVDDARMIKIDFLALGMLSAVEECLELIVDNGHSPIDLSRIDEEEEVYAMIQAGDTVGTFQIESRAQIQTLLKTQPRNLYDLMIQVAIVRPGPIVGGATAPFIEARKAERELGYPVFSAPDPLLEEVLKDTYGVILFQDQILEVAQALAGFSSGEADRLRKALSRKRSVDAVQRFKERFQDGAVANGVSADVAVQVFENIMGFAHYGFPKGHAAAFAMLAYQSSWLRYHYPAEFFCALLNNQPMGFYPPHSLINDAKHTGVQILPADINQSRERCSVRGKRIRIGLGYVQRMSQEQAELIVNERQEHGEYRSLADFVRRVILPRELTENLILVGAFDCFGMRRRESLWLLGLLHPASVAHRKARRTQQLPLALPVQQDAAELRPMTAWEQMSTEYDLLSLSPRWHPMLLLRPQLPDHVVDVKDLADIPDGTPVQLAGLVVCRQQPGTAKGILFLLLEDEHGLVNIVVYPDMAKRDRLLIRQSSLLMVEGRMDRSEGPINIVAQRLSSVDTSKANLGTPDDMGARSSRRLAPAAHNYH